MSLLHCNFNTYQGFLVIKYLSNPSRLSASTFSPQVDVERGKPTWILEGVLVPHPAHCRHHNSETRSPPVKPDAGSRARCTARPNNTETLESGAEKGLLQGHARKMAGSCPPKPRTPGRVSAKLFFFFHTHTHCILFLQEINKLTPNIVNGWPQQKQQWLQLPNTKHTHTMS